MKTKAQINPRGGKFEISILVTDKDKNIRWVLVRSGRKRYKAESHAEAKEYAAGQGWEVICV